MTKVIETKVQIGDKTITTQTLVKTKEVFGICDPSPYNDGEKKYYFFLLDSGATWGPYKTKELAQLWLDEYIFEENLGDDL
jgi:hypothetical protein